MEIKVIPQFETGVQRYPSTKQVAAKDYQDMLTRMASEGYTLQAQIVVNVGVEPTPMLVFVKPSGKKTT